MLERQNYNHPNGLLEISYWIHEPSRTPASTMWIVAGTHTTGDQYVRFCEPFLDDFRIVIPEPHDGSHPVESIEGIVNLNMTAYRHLHKEFGSQLDTYRLIGYSIGGPAASILAADPATDHTPPENLICIAPVPCGISRTFPDFERRFLLMGSRLQFGKEGLSGIGFAARYGAAFIRRAGVHDRTRTRQLLESIENTDIPEVQIPSLISLMEEDEFFTPQEILQCYKTKLVANNTHILAGASHARILHRPDEVARQVQAFYGIL